MSDLRMNSVFGAVLASVLGVMGVGVAAETIFHPHYPEKAGFATDVNFAAGGGGGGPAEPEAAPDFGTLFANAEQLQELVARGERAVAACRSCHTFEAGGAEGQGPNLHDVFGRVAGAHPGYSFSEQMAAYGARWDYETLNAFLTSPAQTVRGTKMAFAGLRRVEDRVAVIAYLRSISPNNVPLPAPAPPPASAAEAPAAEADAS